MVARRGAEGSGAPSPPNEGRSRRRRPVATKRVTAATQRAVCGVEMRREGRVVPSESHRRSRRARSLSQAQHTKAAHDVAMSKQAMQLVALWVSAIG